MEAVAEAEASILADVGLIADAVMDTYTPAKIVVGFTSDTALNSVAKEESKLF